VGEGREESCHSGDAGADGCVGGGGLLGPLPQRLVPRPLPRPAGRGGGRAPHPSGPPGGGGGVWLDPAPTRPPSQLTAPIFAAEIERANTKHVTYSGGAVTVFFWGVAIPLKPDPGLQLISHTVFFQFRRLTKEDEN